MTNGAIVRIGHARAGRNAMVIASVYEALNTRDISALAGLLDEQASWHTPGLSPMAGSWRGREAVCRQLRRYGSDTRGTFRANLLNLLESADGRVVSVHHHSAERPGRERLEVLCCTVFELEHARIIAGRDHFCDLYAWDRFWS